MPRLIAALVRHGAYLQRPGAPSAHQPFPLDTEGRAQARAGGAHVAADLEVYGWSLWPVVDCSTLQRAWETAHIMAQVLESRLGPALALESFDALTERCVGAAANLTVAEIEAVVAADPRFEPPPPGWKADRDYRLPLPGAESIRDAGRRVADHLRSRMEALEGVSTDTVKVFVGHGASIRSAACELGALDPAELPALSMHYARAVYLERASGGWRQIAGAWKQRTRPGLD